jgi:transposase-like protein
VIPAELVQALRSGHAEGTPVAELARRYGVSLSQAYRWIRNPAARPDAIRIPEAVASLTPDEVEIFRLTTAMLLKLGGA